MSIFPQKLSVWMKLSLLPQLVGLLMLLLDLIHTGNIQKERILQINVISWNKKLYIFNIVMCQDTC